MRRKRKGYLLVDIALALSLISLLFLGIGRSFSIYLNNKKYSISLIEVGEIMNSLILELKHNIDYDILDKYEKGMYLFSELTIEKIIDNSIVEILKDSTYIGKTKSIKEGWSLVLKNYDEQSIGLRINYRDDKIPISKSQEEVIYKFLE